MEALSSTENSGIQLLSNHGVITLNIVYLGGLTGMMGGMSKIFSIYPFQP
jgi:hypothetical protein